MTKEVTLSSPQRKPMEERADIQSNLDDLSQIRGIRNLQDVVGNRAVSSLLQSGAASLISGDPQTDSYEREAHEAATELRQFSTSEGSRGGSADLQPVAAMGATPLALGAGAPLPESIAGQMEPFFERDLSAVRIHTDASAAQLADQFQARAFTTGNHIAFDRGAFAPETRSGRELIAHELSHVVQQSSSASVGSVGGPPVVQRAPKNSAPSSILIPWLGSTETSLQAFILTLLSAGDKASEADAKKARTLARRIVSDKATDFRLNEKSVNKKSFEKEGEDASGLTLTPDLVAKVAREVGVSTEIVEATALAMNVLQPAEAALAKIDAKSQAKAPLLKPLLIELAKARDAESFIATLRKEKDLASRLQSLGMDNKRGVINLARAHGLLESTRSVPPPPNTKVVPPSTLAFSAKGKRLLKPLGGIEDLLLEVNVNAWEAYGTRYAKHAENYVKQIGTRDWFSIRDKLGPLELPEKPSDEQVRSKADLGGIDRIYINASKSSVDRIFQLAGVAAQGAIGGEASLKIEAAKDGTGASAGVKAGKKLEGDVFVGGEAGVKIDPGAGDEKEAVEFKAEGEVTKSGASGKVAGAAKAGPVQGEFESGSAAPKVAIEKEFSVPEGAPITAGVEFSDSEIKLKAGVDPVALDVSSDPAKGVGGAGLTLKGKLSENVGAEGRLGFKVKLIALGSEFEQNQIARAIDRSRPSLFEEPKGKALKETEKFKKGIAWDQLTDDEKLTYVVRFNWTQARWDKKQAVRQKAKKAKKP